VCVPNANAVRTPASVLRAPVEYTVGLACTLTFATGVPRLLRLGPELLLDEKMEVSRSWGTEICVAGSAAIALACLSPTKRRYGQNPGRVSVSVYTLLRIRRFGACAIPGYPTSSTEVSPRPCLPWPWWLLPL
jgi:hypothetical protein